MNIRPDIVEPLIAEGCALFASEDTRAHFPQGVPRYNILAWLFACCADAGLALNMLERDRVVERVHARANNMVVPHTGHVLDVAALRALIATLPENTPVLYQRIEDSLFARGWTTVDMNWPTLELPELDEELERALAEGRLPQVRLEQREGKTVLVETSRYIAAFGAYVGTDEHGRRALCIHAHY